MTDTTPWSFTSHYAAPRPTRRLEYVPQIDDITSLQIAIYEGYAAPSAAPGLAVARDFRAIGRFSVEGRLRSIKKNG
jgi:hypothetical protein